MPLFFLDSTGNRFAFDEDDIADIRQYIQEDWTQVSELPELPTLPVEVPQVLTIRQARRVLLVEGLLDDVEYAVQQAPREVQVDWEYATEVRRDWETFKVMQVALGLTDEYIDELFTKGVLL